MLRLGAMRVFVLFCVFVLEQPFCHGALKLDVSTLLKMLILETSL